VSGDINPLIAQICEPGVMLMTLNVKILFFWGVTLCHSIVRPQHLRQCNALIAKDLCSLEELV